MPKRINHRRISKHAVYAIKDLKGDLEVHPNTVTNWQKSGLRSSNQTGKKLFNGAELLRFFNARLEAFKSPGMKPHEFRCFTCQANVYPEPETLELGQSVPETGIISGACPECDNRVPRRVNEVQWQSFRECAIHKTPLYQKDETKLDFQGGFVNPDPAPFADIVMVNDDIIYKWQIHAKQWDDQTRKAKLHAIRAFEEFDGGKPFAGLTIDRVDAFRDHLVALSQRPDGIARSTLQHRAGHLREFIKWLVLQSGYKHLDGGIADAMILKRKVVRQATQPETKPSATFEEVLEMLDRLPHNSLMEERDRALFAATYANGFRAKVQTNLKIGNVDLNTKRTNQNGLREFAKNGKTYDAGPYAGFEPFLEVYLDWVRKLRDLGFSEEDAVFPSNIDLVQKRLPLDASHATVPSMRSEHAIRRVFREASATVSKSYSPHSARRTITTCQIKICRTPAELRAVSQNLGHESLETTIKYYAKLSDTDRFQILEDMASHGQDDRGDFELMLDYHEHRLTRGTPEFKRAECLVKQRRELKDLDMGDVIEV